MYLQDVFDFEKKYKGSEEEAECLKTAYLDFKGDMDKIMDEVSVLAVSTFNNLLLYLTLNL